MSKKKRLREARDLIERLDCRVDVLRGRLFESRREVKEKQDEIDDVHRRLAEVQDRLHDVNEGWRLRELQLQTEIEQKRARVAALQKEIVSLKAGNSYCYGRDDVSVSGTR